MEIIEAMLVLPFEHARLSGLVTLQEKDQYAEGLKFWLYHRRDIMASIDHMQPIKS
jgi:hypothetical protein